MKQLATSGAEGNDNKLKQKKGINILLIYHTRLHLFWNKWMGWLFFHKLSVFSSIFQIGYEKSSTAQQKETPLSLLLNIPNCKTPQAKKLYYNTLISAILRSSMKSRDLISSAGSDVENSPIFLLQWVASTFMYTGRVPLDIPYLKWYKNLKIDKVLISKNPLWNFLLSFWKKSFKGTDSDIIFWTMEWWW